MIIQNSSLEDLNFIMDLFKSAVEYQKSKGYNLWPEFNREFIQKEIKENRHWKITENDIIVCIFSVQYNDPIIWQERDQDPSVYLHRITINPNFKGKGIIKEVKKWALDHARQMNKKYLRMDTWGDNEQLRNYYVNQGFHYIGQHQFNEPENEPLHYGGNYLSLFQNEV